MRVDLVLALIIPSVTSFSNVGAPRSFTLSSDQHSYSHIKNYGPKSNQRRNLDFESSINKPTSTLLLSSNANDVENSNNFIEKMGLGFNPVFGSMWAAILVFAFVLAPGTLNGPEDTELLARFIANPTNSGLNELFLVIFNLFPIVTLVLSGVIFPSVANKKNGLNPTPFVAASAAAGYFALGPYLTLRGQVPTKSIRKTDLGWFTKSVLENKIANYLVLVVALLVPFASGIFTPEFNFDRSLEEYISLVTSSKFVSISTVDLSFLSIATALLIPDDLKRRGFDNDSMAKVIAAATLLLPVIGGAFYCALRPEVNDD